MKFREFLLNEASAIKAPSSAVDITDKFKSDGANTFLKHLSADGAGVCVNIKNLILDKKVFGMIDEMGFECILDDNPKIEWDDDKEVEQLLGKKVLFRIGRIKDPVSDDYNVDPGVEDLWEFIEYICKKASKVTVYGYKDNAGYTYGYKNCFFDIAF